MNDEAMLFDPEKNQFFQLNPTAAFVWSQLAEPSTAERLASEVSNQFEGTSSPDVLRDVHGLLEQMLAHRLIVALE
jgi:coenzyme PQQ synthesis protein D (PqqD)